MKPITSGLIESIYSMSDGRVPRTRRARRISMLWSVFGYALAGGLLLGYCYRAVNP